MSGKTATVKQVAALLDLTPRRVQQLVADGTLPGPVSRGSYDLVGCVHGYVRWLREQADGKKADSARSDWLTRKTAAQARLAELEVEREQGRLISIDDVDRMLSEPLERVRAKILNMPSRYARQIVGAKTVPQAAKKLQGLAEEIMEDLRTVADEEFDD